MNRIVIFFASIVLSVGLLSCSNEDPAEPMHVDSKNVATVKGIAHATLDEGKSDTQYAPSGTKVFLKVSYSALSSLATTGDYLMETTVESNGAFTFKDVPVSNQGSSVSVSGDQFTASVRLADSKNETKKFSVSSQSVSLLVGSTGYVTLDYSGSKYE